MSGKGPPVVLCHGGPGLWDYLGSLAALLDDRWTVVRFDQRGCARSGGHGPYTVAQAVSDIDEVRAAYGFDEVAVVGHSWGAELAVRYAARYPQHATAVAYLAGVGGGDEYRAGYAATRDARLGADRARWAELGARHRTADEEREFCLLQWRPDFTPGPDAARHALDLWQTRPAGAAVNSEANRQLWADRATDDLLRIAASVACPVLMVCGADDPRPWQVTTPLLHALPSAERVVLERAGHAPWVERPDEVRRLLMQFLASVPR